jgi:hypothetical protein
MLRALDIGVCASGPKLHAFCGRKKSSRIRTAHIEIVVMTRHILVVPALALACCELFTAARLSAQAGDAAQKLERLANELALTPEQKRQLVPILLAEAPKVKAIKDDPSLSKLQKLEQLKALHDQTDPQVKAILTPDQYQKLQQIRRQELEQVIKKRLNR